MYLSLSIYYLLHIIQISLLLHHPFSLSLCLLIQTQCLLILPQLLLEPWVGPYLLSLTLHQPLSLLHPQPFLLHQIGDQKSGAPGHPSSTVYQYITPLPLLLYELIGLLEVLVDVCFLLILEVEPQVGDLLGVKEFAEINDREHSPNIVLAHGLLVIGQFDAPQIYCPCLITRFQDKGGPFERFHAEIIKEQLQMGYRIGQCGCKGYLIFYKQQMSSLEIEVIGLKRRIKELEEQITERTRNYLLQIQHVRKGANRAPRGKVQKGEGVSQHDNIIKSLRQEVSACRIENKALTDSLRQVTDKLERVEKERGQLEVQNLTQVTNETRVVLNTVEVDTSTEQEQMDQNPLMNTLRTQLIQTQSLIDQQILELQNTKAQLNTLKQTSATERIGLQQVLQGLKTINQSLMQQSNLRISTIQQLKQQIKQLTEDYEVLREQKQDIDSKWRVSEQYLSEIQANHSLCVSKIESLREQLVISQVLEKQRQREREQMKNNRCSVHTNTDPMIHQQSPRISKSTHHINPQPHPHPHHSNSNKHIKHKDGFKKAQTMQSSKHLHDQELLKQNDYLNEQFIKKEEEYKKLLYKIDDVEKQNNKLIGALESHKRDIEYQKEAQKILHISLSQQKSVLESQKNTIEKLEKEYELVRQQLDLKVEEDNVRVKRERDRVEEEVESFKENSLINNWDQDESQERYNTLKEDSEYGSRTPISRVGDLEQQDSQYSPRCKGKSNIYSSVSHYPSQISKNQSDHYQKKISSKTYQMRPQPSDISSIKSSRVFTCEDLRINIKGILDNSVLVGKGLESIQLIRSLIKQIETYTSTSYSQIISQLDKKKELQMSLSNTGLMKEITQLAKIREQYQQRMEQIREEHQQIIQRKKEQVKQLKEKKERLEWTNQQLKQRVDYLEDEMEKVTKKISESQKENKRSTLPENNQQIDKLKQEKGFLVEKIEKYQQSIGEYDTVKKKLFFENEKQKSQLLCVKEKCRSLEDNNRLLSDSRQLTITMIKQESEQLINVLVEARLEQDRVNRALANTIKIKEQSMGQMAEEIETLHQEIKQREDDLIQVGNHIKEIRAAHYKLNHQSEDQENQRLSIKKEEGHLKAQLKSKQQLLIVTQKELFRHKVQITQLQKLLETDKEKTKGLLRSNRQMADEINTLNSNIETLEKKLAVLSQEESYQTQKTINQFQEVMEKLFYLRKREKESKKGKMNSNLFKSISSAKTDKEYSNQRAGKEYKEMKEILRLVTEGVYEVYAQLPHTSENTSLFEAETKEELFNQLKDIKRFAVNYRSVQSSYQIKIAQVGRCYNMFIKGLINSVSGADESLLIKVIDEAELSTSEKNIIREALPDIIPVKEVITSDQKEKDAHRTSLECSL